MEVRWSGGANPLQRLFLFKSLLEGDSPCRYLNIFALNAQRAVLWFPLLALPPQFVLVGKTW